MVSVRVIGSLFTGNRVTFTCSVEVSVSVLSTVRPVAVWRRGTTQLSNNSRISVSELVSTGSTSLFESNLTINSIEAADSGNYTCEASLVLIATSNVVSTNSTLVSIAVEGEPPSLLCNYCFIMCNELACVSGACRMVATKTGMCVWHWSSINITGSFATYSFTKWISQIPY